MKTRFFQIRAMGTAAMVCWLAAGFLQIAGAQPAPDATADVQSVAPDATVPPPPQIPAGSPLAQVIQLAQSGVDESIIMAFVTNSSGAFNLTSDEIIYLKDIGLPSEVVTAMIQRDEVSQNQTANESSQTISNVSAETPSATPPPAEITDNYFYDTLAPYGGWINVDGYGLCWRPTAVIYDRNWQPYSAHGHWVYTDCGWYWLSDYSWGVTFHYGRWFHDARFGWCWWPDTVWAPSWVTWRYTDDYCGWAPLPPFTAYAGGGFTYHGVTVAAGFNFGLAADAFVFVPTKNFYDAHPYRYRVAPAQAAVIYNRAAIVNHFNFVNHNLVNAGIPPERITAVTRTEIHPVAVREIPAPGQRAVHFQNNSRTLVVNRPHFSEAGVTSLHNGVRPHPAPAWGQNSFHPANGGNPNFHATTTGQTTSAQWNRHGRTFPAPMPVQNQAVQEHYNAAPANPSVHNDYNHAPPSPQARGQITPRASSNPQLQNQNREKQNE